MLLAEVIGKLKALLRYYSLDSLLEVLLSLNVGESVLVVNSEMQRNAEESLVIILTALFFS